MKYKDQSVFPALIDWLNNDCIPVIMLPFTVNRVKVDGDHISQQLRNEYFFHNTNSGLYHRQQTVLNQCILASREGIPGKSILTGNST